MKGLTVVRRFGGRFAGVVAVSAAASAPAFADYGELTGAVSAGDITLAIFAIGAVIAAILAVRMGVRKVLGMIR